MKNLFCICGPSSCGKDTIYKELLGDIQFDPAPVVLYTTRPMRQGEVDGREYHFVTDEDIRGYENKGSLIEKRVYHTVHGDWTYATVSDKEMEENDRNYLVIGTPASYVKLRDYFGADKVWPVLLHVDDGVRLRRALDRESNEENPKYAEMCRRFLADSEDFAPERIREAGITTSFENDGFEKCLEEIRAYIKEKCAG